VAPGLYTMNLIENQAAVDIERLPGKVAENHSRALAKAGGLDPGGALGTIGSPWAHSIVYRLAIIVQFVAWIFSLAGVWLGPVLPTRRP